MFRGKQKLCFHSLREKRGWWGGRQTQRQMNRGTETEEQRQIYRQTETERDGGKGGGGGDVNRLQRTAMAQCKRVNGYTALSSADSFRHCYQESRLPSNTGIMTSSSPPYPQSLPPPPPPTRTPPTKIKSTTTTTATTTTTTTTTGRTAVCSSAPSLHADVLIYKLSKRSLMGGGPLNRLVTGRAVHSSSSFKQP